jgi:type II secretory pathway component PulJ
LITERADRLVAVLARRDTLRVDVRRVDSFQTRETQLRRAVERVEPLARACALLRARGEPVPGAAERVAAAVQQVAALRRLYGSDRDAFVDPKQAEFRRFESVLEHSCGQVEAAVLGAWRRYLDRHRPALSGDTLNVLSRVPAYASHVRTIRELGQRLTALGDRLPRDGDAFTEVERIEARIREAWDALDSAALSPAVVEFLRASSTTEGAALALLTPEVLKWVGEHGLQEGFRVHVGEAGRHW